MPTFSHAGRYGPELFADDAQKPQPNKEFEVFLWGTTTPATLYASSDKTDLLDDLPRTDALGNGSFYADFAEPEIPYGVRLVGEGRVVGPLYVTEPAEDTLNLSHLGVLVASLDDDGFIPLSQFPPEALSGVVAIIPGVGAPTADQGLNGQLYFDKQAVAFYGPKTDAGWGTAAIAKGEKGEPGSQGSPGQDGARGQDGRTIFSGQEAPNTSLGQPGDFYIRYTGSVPTSFWGPKSQATGWGSSGSSLIGPAGQPGQDGTDGAPGATGPQGPPGTSDVVFRGVYNPATAYVTKDQVSYNGLLYIANTGSTGVAPVVGGNATWAQATSAGPAGANGKTLLIGTVAPPSNLGTDGDSYFDKSAKNFYGPKASGAWPAAVPLKGDTGTAGTPGTNGTNGASLRAGTGTPPAGIGIDGDIYVDKATLLLYGPKAAGVWPSTGVSIKGEKGEPGTPGASGSIPLDLLLRLPAWSWRVPTYDSQGRINGGTVKWADSSLGVHTVLSRAADDEDTIESFSVTHVASGALVTQPAPTRKADGDVTDRPDKVITYPNGTAPDYDPSSPAAIQTGEVYAESLLGYVADGVTDMRFWVQNAIDYYAARRTVLRFGASGGTVNGARVALSGVVDIRDMSLLKFPPRPKWLYKGQPPFSFVPQPGVTFDGNSMFRIQQPSSGAINMVDLENLVAYGQNTDGTGTIANIHGLEVIGETFGVRTTHCGFRRFGKLGIKYTPIVNQDGTGKSSRGHEHLYLSTESCAGGGIDTDGLTDFSIDYHHAHFCGVDSTDPYAGGVRLRGAGDIKYTNGRATFCERGMVTGDSSITQGRPNSHSIIVSGFNSDRSRYGGLEHRAHGTRTWTFDGCVFGRDGRVESHNSPDAATISATDSYAVLIDGGEQSTASATFTGCSTQFGCDDNATDRAAQSSAATGVLLYRNGYTSWIGGELAGTIQTSLLSTNSHADRFVVSAGTILTTGNVDAPARSFKA